MIKEKENKQNDSTKANYSIISDNENNVFIEKEKESEKKDEELENSNVGKNATSAMRGILEIGGIVLKALTTALEVTF